MRSALLLVVVILAACRGPQVRVGKYSLDKQSWEEARGLIVTRASFELRCPEERLSLSVLGTWPGADDRPNQVGVEGCEHRLVYVDQGWSRWVLNSEQKATP